MELLLRVLKWSLTAGAVTVLVALLKPLLDRRFTPRWRYWLWLVLAAALILSPVSLGSLLPALPEPAVTVTAPEVRVPVPGRTRTAPETPGTPVTPDDPVTPVDPVTPDDPVTPSDPETPGTPVTPADPVASEPPVTPDQPYTDTAAGQTVELSAILTAAWLLGAAVFALWHVAGTALLSSRLRRWSVPAGGGTVSLCGELSRELGLRRMPRVGVSRSLASPLVVGLFRPRLWLPDRAWEEQELAFILRHELTHIKRRDLWYKALMLFANALHWFNPLVWLLRREAGETVELLCDAQALRGADRETRRAYCETLLEHICRVRGAALTTHFYGGKNSVKTRFKNLLSNNKRRFGWAALVCCVLVLTVTACAVGVGATKSVPPKEFDGKYTASLYKHVYIRDENGQSVQDKAVLINSTDELDKLRRDYGIEPMDGGYRVINGELVEKLDGYTKDYFRENVLIVLIREMGSGSFDLSVESVELSGDNLAVTVSSYNPTAPDATMDLCQWCILVECKRVEGVASAKCSFLPERGPTEEPDDASLPERVGETLLESASGAVMKVNWNGDVTNFVITDTYGVEAILHALTDLRCTPSDANSLPEDEMSILFETGDGRYGARLGKSGGPLELIWEGASSFYELSETQHEALWTEFYRIAQNVPGIGFIGITVDGSLTVDDAIVELADKMAQNIRALPDWVEWKPVDFQPMEIEVVDAYFGEPQNFCACLYFAVDFGPGGPDYSQNGSPWSAGSSLIGPYTGEFEGYYGWYREVGVFRNDGGQWELVGTGTENAFAYLPGWTYTSDLENSIYSAPLEELMRIFTLSRGNTHSTVALSLCRKSPEELTDLPSALTVLTVDEARELFECVRRYIEKVDQNVPTPSDTLVLEAIEEYIGG